MPQISPIKRELIIVDNKVMLLEGRSLRFRRRKTPAKDLSSEEIYERKRNQRLERAQAIKTSGTLSDYINWIIEIQKRLNLTNAEFASRLNVSCQSVKLWKRRTGHFPSERTLIKLLQLELESRIPIKIIKIKYGVRI